jgi:threonine dehydrogenase-like Zn-dependent dehydrogenase
MELVSQSCSSIQLHRQMTVATASAPRFLGQGKIEFAEHPIPSPGARQLLLRVRANAICGTDRAQYYDGSDVVPGHEAVGTVDQAGLDTTIPVGTTGAVYLMDFCGRCRSCVLGLTNQCLAKRADMGFTHDGGFGPYELVHETNFFPIPDDLSPVEATLLLDVMGTSGHAIQRARLVRPDITSIYIGGAGPIGLGLLVVGRLAFGPDVPIHIADISSWRREYAGRLGGIPIDPADQPALRALPPHDVAFDSTGKTAARQAALAALGKRGALICVGHGESLTLDVSADLIAPERAVLGSEYFPYSDLAANLELLQANRSALRAVITHTYPLEQISEAFQAFISGETGKVVVTQDPN